MRALKLSGLVVVCLIGWLQAGMPARAEDFLSALFGSFTGQRPPPQMPDPFAPFQPSQEPVQPRPPRGSSQAFCVRSCDGRYFPLASPENGQSRASLCSDLCPGSETYVAFGSSIEHAYTPAGRAYSDYPNAFRYRKEFVKDCTCNGRAAFGLARIKVENDPTVRSGDLVSSGTGLLVANGTDRRGAVNLVPASRRSGDRAEAGRK